MRVPMHRFINRGTNIMKNKMFNKVSPNATNKQALRVLLEPQMNNGISKSLMKNNIRCMSNQAIGAQGGPLLGITADRLLAVAGAFDLEEEEEEEDEPRNRRFAVFI